MSKLRMIRLVLGSLEKDEAFEGRIKDFLLKEGFELLEYPHGRVYKHPLKMEGVLTEMVFKEVKNVRTNTSSEMGLEA